MTCKKCIHYDVCGELMAQLHWKPEPCRSFKDKSRIIETPCGIGDSLFYIHRTVQGNDYILKANVLAVIVAIYDDTKKFYLKIIYEDADGYTDRATAIYGVNAFSSYEEAELKLKELRLNIQI